MGLCYIAAVLLKHGHEVEIYIMQIFLIVVSIMKLMNSHSNINLISVDDNTLVTNRIGSTEKSAKDLNFVINTTIEEGLSQTIQWKLKQGSLNNE